MKDILKRLYLDPCSLTFGQPSQDREAAAHEIQHLRNALRRATAANSINQHKKSIDDDAMHLRMRDPFIGERWLRQVHMESLEPFIEARRKDEVKTSTSGRERAASWKAKYHKAAPEGFRRVRVHDLKHTFGRRLRAAGVSFEDRQDLLGHKNSRITTHYSAAEVGNLIAAAEKVCSAKSHNSPTITLLRRQAA